jgi:hypothetical protein
MPDVLAVGYKGYLSRTSIFDAGDSRNLGIAGGVEPAIKGARDFRQFHRVYLIIVREERRSDGLPEESHSNQRIAAILVYGSIGISNGQGIDGEATVNEAQNISK